MLDKNEKKLKKKHEYTTRNTYDNIILKYEKYTNNKHNQLNVAV